MQSITNLQMDGTETIFRIILTIIFGAILGLEAQSREFEKQGIKKAEQKETERLGGLRTYTILSMLGGIAGIFYVNNVYEMLYLITSSVILFLLSAYVLNIQHKHAFGLTTEFAVLITYFLGFFVTSKLIAIEVVIVILVLLAFFVSQKENINNFVTKIKHKEFIDLAKFGLVSLVILPVLPNETFTFGEILSKIGYLQYVEVDQRILNFSVLNPFSTWLIVCMISGFGIVGYMLSKFIGNKQGLVVSSMLGGLVSSTATTISFARNSKTMPENSQSLAGGTILASAVSVIPVLSLISVSNINLGKEIFPYFLAMLMVGLLVGFSMVLSQSKTNTENTTPKYQAFTILPAIKFVLFLTSLKLLIQLVQLSPVSNFFLVFTSLSGFVGLDAPSIAVADLTANESLQIQTGVLAILLANTINLLAKGLYAEGLGGKKYISYTSIGLSSMVLSVIFTAIFLA